MKLFSYFAAAALCCSGAVAEAGVFGCGDAPSCAAPCAPTCAAPVYSSCDTGCTGYAAPSYNYCCPAPKKSLCERLFGGMKGGMKKMGGLFSCCKKQDDCCQPSYCAPATCAAPMAGCGEVISSGCGDVCGAAPTCAAPCASSCAPVTCAAPVDACGSGCGEIVAPTCAAPCGCN